MCRMGDTNMYQSIKLDKLEDYFRKPNERNPKGYYFARVAGYDQGLLKFLGRYYKEAGSGGIYLSSGLANPTGDETDELFKLVGNEVRLNKPWLEYSMRSWIPFLDEKQLAELSDSFLIELQKLKESGLNNDILKNVYLKFMVWLKFRMKPILFFLGKYNIVKVMYEGKISKYELYFLAVIARTGADILLINFEDDSAYLKIDPASHYAQPFQFAKKGRPDIDYTSYDWAAADQAEKLKNAPAAISVVTNRNNVNTFYGDAVKNFSQRGSTIRMLHNYYVYIKGVDKEQEYSNQLYRFREDLLKANKEIILVDKRIGNPTFEEVQKISSKQCPTNELLLTELSNSVTFSTNRDLDILIKKSFYALMEAHLKLPTGKFKSLGISIICWYRRYLEKPLKQMPTTDIPVFLYLGRFTENEGLFFEMISGLPLDVFIFSPDPDPAIVLPSAAVINYENTAPIETFPTNDRQMLYRTAASEAEGELTDIMYTGTGLYRRQQFMDSRSIVLQTTYDEIGILWNQEAKYRPGFEEFADKVMVPTIFAKISGVKEGNVPGYWREIASRMTPDTILIKHTPYIRNSDYLSMGALNSIYKNGKWDVEKLKEHGSYKFEYLSGSVQSYLLSKLKELIDLNCFKGSNEINAKIVSVFLNLDKQTVRMIQKYDFTKEIPKVILVHTTETMCSLEDCIYIAFLSLVGFDILIYSPTGYQTMDKYYTPELMAHHIIGEYIFDLTVPDLKRYANQQSKGSLLDRVFGKGRS